MDEIVKDERFKHIVKDQRFKIMPKNERKVKIDKRFKNMFHDKKFKLKYTVDKRGRPTNLTTNDNLKKYYELSSDEEEEDEEDGDKDENGEEEKPGTSSKKDKNTGKVKKDEAGAETTTTKKKDAEKDEDDEDGDESEESSSESEEDEKNDDGEEKEDDDDEEESDEESSDDESVVQEEEEIPWNELDKDTYRDEKTSSRLAVCNMDWDRIKAVDLFVLFNSFKPAQGVIKSIKIYISDYGKERLDYEKLHGPKELTETTVTTENSKQTVEKEENDEMGVGGTFDSDSESEQRSDEDGDDFDRRKLRIYQFNRLRYYYAIIECDNEQTAEKIYAECDGMEYESSCNRIDLRFVPDDTEFDEVDVRDSCTETPDPVSYKPNLYFTTALNQTRVECTWDETPHDRLALTMRKFTEDDLKTCDFRGILATSSEEEDNDDNNDEDNKKVDTSEETEKKESNEPETEEDRIRRFRELLLGDSKRAASKKNRDADLEFDWEGGAIKEEGFNELLFNSGNKKKANSKKFGKKNVENKRDLTEEEKKEQAQLSLLTMDDEDNKAHFNLDDLLVDKKGKKGKPVRKSQHDETKTNQDNFKLDLEDPRFQAIFTSHEFNIDPSDQSFKKTKAMENLLDEKIKRMEKPSTTKDADEGVDKKKPTMASDESLLVKSIKSKTEVLKRKREENQEKYRSLKTKRF